MKLHQWQKEVAYGDEKSLVVPAGRRTGKDVAVAFAMKEKSTLVIVPNRNRLVCMSDNKKKYIGKQCCEPSQIAENSYFATPCYYEGIGKQVTYEQIIFNEVNRINLIRLLQLRDKFDGRIVVIGTPLGIPCPIFYPLSKMKGWKFIDTADEYRNSEYNIGIPNSKLFNVWRHR